MTTIIIIDDIRRIMVALVWTAAEASVTGESDSLPVLTITQSDAYRKIDARSTHTYNNKLL